MSQAQECGHPVCNVDHGWARVRLLQPQQWAIKGGQSTMFRNYFCSWGGGGEGKNVEKPRWYGLEFHDTYDTFLSHEKISLWADGFGLDGLPCVERREHEQRPLATCPGCRGTEHFRSRRLITGFRRIASKSWYCFYIRTFFNLLVAEEVRVLYFGNIIFMLEGRKYSHEIVHLNHVFCSEYCTKYVWQQ